MCAAPDPVHYTRVGLFPGVRDSLKEAFSSPTRLGSARKPFTCRVAIIDVDDRLITSFRMSSRTVAADPSYFQQRSRLVSTLDAPAHIKIEKVFSQLKEKTARRTQKKAQKSGGKNRRHDCARDGCPVLAQINAATFQAIAGFENELPVHLCREKIISDAVDNVDMYIRAVSAISPVDLDIYTEHAVGEVPKQMIDSLVKSESLSGGSGKQPDQSVNDFGILEVPTVMNAAGAIAERRQTSRRFLETLDDCGLVPIACRSDLSKETLLDIKKQVVPADHTAAALDTRPITSLLGGKEEILPVRILAANDGVFVHHFCKSSGSQTWTFQPTSVSALLLKEQGYEFHVYCPHGPLSHWSPRLRDGVAASCGSSSQLGSHGSNSMNLAALSAPDVAGAGSAWHQNSFSEMFSLRTPKHIVYPRYVEYMQALIDARRARSYNTYPIVVTETKHDMKQVESMSSLERNQMAALEAQREQLIMEGRRMAVSPIGNVMNPLLGTQLIPGSLVNVSVQFSELEHRRRIGDMEDQSPDDRMTSYYNSAGEMTRKASLSGMGRLPLSSQGAGPAAMVNPTPGEPVTPFSKRIVDNSYAALSAMAQQSSNISVLAQPRLNDHILSLPRESKVAHISMPKYAGETESNLYHSFRSYVLEAYHVPHSVMQTGQQGQWGVSRSIPIFGAMSRNIIAATFNMESRGYGDFISKIHDELQQFFQWLYDKCLASIDSQLLDTITERELARSKRTHDKLVKLVEQYTQAWRDAQLANDQRALAQKQLNAMRSEIQQRKRDAVEKAAKTPVPSEQDNVREGQVETRFDVSSEAAELSLVGSKLTDVSLDYMKKEALARDIQSRIFMKHHQYANLTQYLYFLSLAAQGRTAIKFEFMPTKRYMDNIETERANFEYQLAMSSRHKRGGESISSEPVGSSE